CTPPAPPPTSTPSLHDALPIFDALEEMGVIDRITLGSRGAVYHLADHAHHHLVCGRCGAVEEIPAELLAPVLEALADRTAFALDRPRVAITGLCPACRAAG